jgi:hypothetical protein
MQGQLQSRVCSGYTQSKGTAGCARDAMASKFTLTTLLYAVLFLFCFAPVHITFFIYIYYN